jgi:DNA-binding NarL/FixJ family response regulator
VRALIVDDHEPFRASARLLLELEGFDVVGEAADGAAALAMAESLRPELVLLDVSLPDLSGFDVAARLAAAPVPAVVVLVSNRDSSEFGPRARRTPALGFIPKEQLSGERLTSLLARTG